MVNFINRSFMNIIKRELSQDSMLFNHWQITSNDVWSLCPWSHLNGKGLWRNSEMLNHSLVKGQMGCQLTKRPLGFFSNGGPRLVAQLCIRSRSLLHVKGWAQEWRKSDGCFSPNLISSPWRRYEDYNISFCKQWKFRCHCSYEQWHLNLHCLQRGPSCP